MSTTYAARDGEPGALEGIRVVDLTIARAGPTCTRQLADLGAGVIHVGAPRRADLGGSDSHNLHRGQRSIVIDLKREAGRGILLRLVERADVLVENFRAEVKRRLDIGYETLAALNPRLVYASISGFGQDGPYAGRPGLDQVVQGMGGLMSVTGPPGSGPWRTGIAISDTAAGSFLTQGVLAALYARERTGRGQWVHTSLLEAMVNFMDFQAARWLIDGVVPGQAGNDHPTLFPMGTFEARDGPINIAVLGGWERFVTAIGAPELCEDPRFADLPARIRNRDALREIVEQKLSARSAAEWVGILNAADLPCGPVLAMDEVFADPQIRHLQLTRRVEHERDGSIDVLRHPVTLSETPTSVQGGPPLPGSHTREILEEYGLTAEQVDGLLADGTVVSAR